MADIAVKNDVRVFRTKIQIGGKQVEVEINSDNGSAVVIDNSRDTINMNRKVSVPQSVIENGVPVVHMVETEDNLWEEKEKYILQCDGKRALSVHRVNVRNRDSSITEKYAFTKWRKKGDSYRISEHLFFSGDELDALLLGLRKFSLID